MLNEAKDWCLAPNDGTTYCSGNPNCIDQYAPLPGYIANKSSCKGGAD